MKNITKYKLFENFEMTLQNRRNKSDAIKLECEDIILGLVDNGFITDVVMSSYPSLGILIANDSRYFTGFEIKHEIEHLLSYLRSENMCLTNLIIRDEVDGKIGVRLKDIPFTHFYSDCDVEDFKSTEDRLFNFLEINTGLESSKGLNLKSVRFRFEPLIKNMKTFEKYNSDKVDIKDTIKNLKKVSKELKEVALTLLKSYTRAGKGRISELELHPLLKKKIREGGYPNGFSMGIDVNGYYIHTHRARSKSHDKPDGITAKEMKFIDSTG